MTFEQPARLNRFVADPLPLTWGTRWKFIRVFLPILAFSTFVVAETLSFKLWTRGQLEVSRLWPALAMLAFSLVFLLVLNELQMRGSKGANRLLNVLERGISFRAAGRPVIRWSKVVAFWFEGILEEPELSKVTVEYFGDRKTKLPRRDSLVLDKRNQCPALLSELSLLQQRYNLSFRLELDRSLPPRKPPRNLVLGMSLYLAGVLFLLHGLPLLFVAVAYPDGKSHHSESKEDWSPEQKEKYAEFLKAHFSSKAEFNRFVIGTSSILTLLGVGLMVLGNVVQRPKPEGESSVLPPKWLTPTQRSR